MSADEFPREPVVAKPGDEICCPGCNERVVLHEGYGWRNGGGYSCNPWTSTHSQHIETVLSSDA